MDRTTLTYCFDLDGTLCTNTEGDYESAEAYPDAIREVNRLHHEGHRIIIQTARGSSTGIDWRPLTEKQLAAWNVSYDALFLGKPSANVYIDDKAVNVFDWRRNGFSEETLRHADQQARAASVSPARV